MRPSITANHSVDRWGIPSLPSVATCTSRWDSMKAAISSSVILILPRLLGLAPASRLRAPARRFCTLFAQGAQGDDGGTAGDTAGTLDGGGGGRCPDRGHAGPPGNDPGRGRGWAGLDRQ